MADIKGMPLYFSPIIVLGVLLLLVVWVKPPLSEILLFLVMFSAQ